MNVISRSLSVSQDTLITQRTTEDTNFNTTSAFHVLNVPKYFGSIKVKTEVRSLLQVLTSFFISLSFLRYLSGHVAGEIFPPMKFTTYKKTLIKNPVVE